jgi:hypothetical protein
MPWISQKQATAKLREATGLSIAACRAMVARFPGKVDGKRRKVFTGDIDNAIAVATRVPQPKPAGTHLNRRNLLAIKRAIA